MGIGARLAVLRLRDLRFVFLASLISQVGDGVVNVALAFAVLDLTGSASDLGLVIAVRTISQVLALLMGGVVSDRVSRRSVMMASDTARFLVQVGIGVLLISGHASVADVALSQVLVGAATGFFIPAASGLMPAVAGDHLQQANALQGIAGAGSGIIGPAAGGVLVVVVGAPWALVVDGLTYLASALLLTYVSHLAAAARARTAASFFTDLHDGFREFASRTWVWALILTFSVGNSLGSAFEVLGPLICKRHYGGAPAFAVLNAALAAGAFVGGVVLLRFRPKRPLRAGVLMCLPFALPGLLLALQVPLIFVVPAALIAGIGPTAFNALWLTTLQQRVPPDVISRVISYDFAGSLGLQPFGYLLAGPLALAIGLSPALIVCAGGACVMYFSSLLARDVRQLESLPPAASAGPPDRSRAQGAFPSASNSDAGASVSSAAPSAASILSRTELDNS